MPLKNYNSITKDDNINNYTLRGYADSTSTAETKTIIKNTTGIFGIPYQFMGTCDRRIDGTDIGAKYAQKIVSKMPLLFMTPCRQKFMPGYDEEESALALDSLIKDDSTFLAENISKNGRYYTTEWQWPEYYRYVQTLCTETAHFMGVANKKIPTRHGMKAIRDINWAEDLKNGEFDRYFNAQSAVVFYVDGSSVSTMSESFSNSTTESSLSSTINGYSQTVNEVKFLLGENSALKGMMETANETVQSGIISNISDAFSGITGGMLSDLGQTGVSTVLTGGKLVFPKLWQDSSFSRSYSFDIKLRSPDHDNLSIFLNIMVPYLHLLALVLPISHEEHANSYNAPFLVKAYCKGLFNIDMGMITDLSVSRGGECQWNDAGLPTQMDISISIEDLYSTLYMTSLTDTTPPVLINKLKNSLSVVRNTYMLDYLANLSGLNIADQEIARATQMLLTLAKGTFSGTTNDIYNKFDLAVARLLSGLYTRL